MEYLKKSRITVDVLVSFAIIIGTLYDFDRRISAHFDWDDPTVGITPYAMFMAGMTFLSLFILFAYGVVNNKNRVFIWVPVFYVFLALASTMINGLYPVQKLPFKFIELFYWVAMMAVAYYSVLNLGTPKYHVAIVALAIPYLAYKFYLARSAEISTDLLLNPVFYISFSMPIVLMIRSKLLKTGLLLLIFVTIVLSYKRMPIIAFVMSIPVYFYCITRSGPDANLWKNLAILFGGIVFVAILVIAFKEVAGLFGLDWGGRMSTLVESGGSGRTWRWQTIISEIISQPAYWLIGHGDESLHMNFKIWAHNDVLEIIYEFGLLCFALYVVFAIKLLRTFFEMKKYKYKHFAAFAVSLVWAFWGGMTDVFINYPYHFLIIALFWGITVADFENSKKEAELNAFGELYWPSYEDEKMMEPS